MKKRISLALAAALLAGICVGFCGCGAENGKKTDGISVVATVFPAYDWVRAVVGETDTVELTMLLDDGVDLHSFQPSADDVVRIAGCDLFLYVGGESDGWVEDTLGEGGKDSRIVLDLIELLGDAAKTEEAVEGMEAEEDGEDGEEAEYDEHVWLSLKNAGFFVEKIRDALSELDKANAETYAANAEAYLQELSALDREFVSAIGQASRKTLLFGDRFPFRYLADDYGLTYYAAFPGCSAESEASFETVLFLAKKVDELALPVVLTTEGSDGRIAQTVIGATEGKNAEVLAMDSMQSTTAKDVKNGKTYLSAMKQNLEVLKKALR